ncbi:MAG: T9SS type A sorting domain-containing protein [Candidatus Cloacimonetes bacterium]|nr:T9SS type A sorting domain-containing protein [Candidatus Cloacimonadota bacterium]
MKRLMIILAVLAAAWGLAALPAFECANEGDAVHMIVRTQTQATAPVIQKTVAIPAADAEVVIHSMSAATYDSNGNQLSTSFEVDPSRVVISNSFVMREMQGFTVRLEMERDTPAGVSRILEVDFELQPLGGFEMPTTVSEAFIPVYRNMAANYETSYLPNLPISVPHMLIIGHQQLDTMMQPFMAWKRSRGMQISTANIEDISTNSSEIKDWIVDFYNNAENKPDYLLLIGDVIGTFTIPSFYTTSESNVADLSYTLIKGDDYLPEMIAGRISISSLYHFLVITRKIMSYEMEPEVGDWMERTLVVAGNHSDSPPIPVTPVLMSRWLHDQMVDYGYAQVDTVFYPPTFPGTTQIATAINNGVQFASYRGWGAADGWHYPIFHSANAQATTSGDKMPIVTSIVCNTGDFANTANSNACFGEVWMRMGSPSEPNGCVAFVGPSDLHTSTEKNNAISSGLYHSIFHEGVRSFGAAVLRGKAELYNNYPNDLESSGQVEFYFWVYNILTDPSLNMWVRTPPQIYASIPGSVPQGTNYLQFDNLPSGTVVTATRDMIEFTRVQSYGGTVILPLDTQEPGDIEVTVWNKYYIPRMRTITVVESDAVGITGWSVDGMVAGGAPELTLTATNYGDDIANLTATLSSGSPWFTGAGGSFEFGAVAADASADAAQTFGIDADCPDGETIIMQLDFSTGEVAKLDIPVTSLLFEVVSTTVNDGGNGVLDPGETADIVLEVANIGTMTATDATVTLLPSTTALTVHTAEVAAGTIAPGETAQVTFSVEAAADAYPGRNGRLQATVTDDADRSDFAYAYLVIGEVDNTAPTGPDNYGYYCYDNNDNDWDEAPTYDWHVIDPDEGGPGSVILMGDDVSQTLDLPFTFRYYGQDYDQITVCSNGWIAMGETWQINFRNWNIPAALGPDALIAPYWDDLKGLVHDSVVDDIRLVTWHDTAEGNFVIQWNDAYNQCNNTSIERFEAILEPRAGEDGDIVFQYHTVDNPDTGRNFCTVGIQGAGHQDGLLYTYANHYPASATPLAPGLAMRFTTDPPDPYVGNGDNETPAAAFALEQNWPNPFNPTTTIAFSLAEPAHSTLCVYNLRGQRIATLADEAFEAGRHEIVWQGRDDAGREVGSGVYLYRLRTGGETLVRRMVLLK